MARLGPGGGGSARPSNAATAAPERQQCHNGGPGWGAVIA